MNLTRLAGNAPLKRQLELETARLRLRPFTPADGDGLFAILGDRETMAYSFPMIRGESDRFLEQSLLRRDPPVGYALEVPGLAGYVLFCPLEDPGTYELGWFLRRDLWGRGYAGEISRTLLDYAFDVLGLRQVVGETIDLRRAGRLLAVAPARCVLAGVLMLAGIGGMILLFPVSVFWAVLFGFWLPGLAAMQTLFPVLRQEYGVEVRSIPRPAAPDKPLTAQEQKKRSRANWWYYNWGIVAVAAMVIVGVAYVAHGLLTTVDPDYTVAVVTAEALPDEAVQRLQTALADYAEDANGDGTVVVQVNNYTWSTDAALTDMNGQMAGATQMNTDLANGESKIWILDDPEGFEQAYGALSEKLGAEWQTKLIPWRSQPALSGLELGSYNTAADGSQTVDIQRRFAGYSVAVFDASDALWQALNS